LGTQFAHIASALGATETTETDLGTIDVPFGASVITGICASCAVETGTTAEGMLAWARMSFPGSGILDGIPVALSSMEDLGVPGAAVPEFMPVNIPVQEKIPIKCFMTMTLAQTGTMHGKVALRFE